MPQYTKLISVMLMLVFFFFFLYDNLPLDLLLIKMFSSCDPMSYLCGGNFV